METPISPIKEESSGVFIAYDTDQSVENADLYEDQPMDDLDAESDTESVLSLVAGPLQWATIDQLDAKDAVSELRARIDYTASYIKPAMDEFEAAEQELDGIRPATRRGSFERIATDEQQRPSKKASSDLLREAFGKSLSPEPGRSHYPPRASSLSTVVVPPQASGSEAWVPSTIGDDADLPSEAMSGVELSGRSMLPRSTPATNISLSEPSNLASESRPTSSMGPPPRPEREHASPSPEAQASLQPRAQSQQTSAVSSRSSPTKKKAGRPRKAAKVERPPVSLQYLVQGQDGSWVTPARLNTDVQEAMRAHVSLLHEKPRFHGRCYKAIDSQDFSDACLGCQTVEQNAKLCDHVGSDDDGQYACGKCCQSAKQPCARLIERPHNPGVLVIAFVPLPEDQRGEATWYQLGYWVRPFAQKQASVKQPGLHKSASRASLRGKGKEKDEGAGIETGA